MERYVKYLRKSRFDRDYAELSVEETLKRHEEILDRLARDRGYTIAKTYREVVSGESISARPEIQKLLQEVNAGLYEGVLVVDVERLARGNGADQAYISQVFQFSGTKIITPMKVYDPSNEFDEEYFEFGLFMSRREYKTINRRLVRGRESSAAEGKYIGSVAPYGYDRVKLPDQKGFTLKPNPEEAKIIRKIFEMYTQRDGTKIIANYLNDHSIPTRHGEFWTYSTVAGILSNPVYLGKIKRGFCKQYRSIDENGVIRKRIRHMSSMADYQIYDGMHPALIEEDIFQAAQEIKAEKSAGGPRVRTSETVQNAFCGLIFCAECGKRIARTVSTVERGSKPRFRCVNARNCHNGSAGYETVETEIIHALRVWFEGYKVRIDTSGFEDEISECRRLIDQAGQDIESVNSQMERAFNLVEQGIYTVELFRERKEKLMQELSEKQNYKNVLEAKLQSFLEADDPHTFIIPQTETLLASYYDMDAREQNRLLKAILQKIEYRKNPSGEITIDLYPRLPMHCGVTYNIDPSSQ